MPEVKGEYAKLLPLEQTNSFTNYHAARRLETMNEIGIHLRMLQAILVVIKLRRAAGVQRHLVPGLSLPHGECSTRP